MAEVPNWQRQSMSKSAPAAVSKKSSVATKLNPKIAKPTFACNVVSSTSGSMFKNAPSEQMTPKRAYADGGEVMSDKDLGLQASKDEDVGFFKLLSMGNIDEPGSEANVQFGSGRGAMERTVSEAKSSSASMPESDPVADIERAVAKESSAAAPVAAAATPTTAPSAPAKQSFGQAFAENRKAGNKVFDWGGKSFNTNLKSAGKKTADTPSTSSAPDQADSKPVTRSAPASAKKSDSAPVTQTATQKLGKDFQELDAAARKAEASTTATPQSKAMVRKMADEAKVKFEDSAKPSASAKDSQALGATYQRLMKAYSDMPAGTSPAAKTALKNLVDQAQARYTASAKA